MARIIAERTKARFVDFSAVTSGIKEIKKVMAEADHSRMLGKRPFCLLTKSTVLTRRSKMRFCHLWKKGSIILIGATTENPLLR